MSRSQILFFILGGFFITNAIVAELIGGKIFAIGMPQFLIDGLLALGIDTDKFQVSVGLLPWPIVFIATDLVNEFFGRRGVQFYTFTTIGLILYTLLILEVALRVTAVDFSPVTQDEFVSVFGQSQRIILASVVAFAVSQLLDVLVFSRVRGKTGGRHLWARATGSTIISQLIDTFIIGFLAFKLPGIFTWEQYLEVTIVSYLYKVIVAILITPLCYLGHAGMRKFLGKEEAMRLVQQAHGQRN